MYKNCLRRAISRIGAALVNAQSAAMTKSVFVYMYIFAVGNLTRRYHEREGFAK